MLSLIVLILIGFVCACTAFVLAFALAKYLIDKKPAQIKVSKVKSSYPFKRNKDVNENLTFVVSPLATSPIYFPRWKKLKYWQKKRT